MSDAKICFDSINLVVTNMAASREFYAHLGLDFGNTHDEVWGDHHVVAVDAAGDGVNLDFELDSASFARKWNRGWHGGTGAVLGFRVSTRLAVDDLAAELSAKG